MGKSGKCSTCKSETFVSLANDLHGKRRYMCNDCWFWEVSKRARINGNIAGKHLPHLRSQLP